MKFRVQKAAPAFALILSSFALAACERQAASTSPIDEASRSKSSASTPQADNAFGGIEVLFDSISREAPSFAGLFLEDGAIVVQSSDEAQANLVASVARRLLPSVMQKNRSTSVRAVKYTFVQLANFRSRVFSSLPSGIVSIDLDERSNRIAIGISEGSSNIGVTRQLEQIGLPSDAFTVEQAPSVELRQIVTLTDRVRPILGGVEMAWKNGSPCTVGINGQWATAYSIFWTASHCSKKPYGLDVGTTFYFQASFPQFVQDRIGWEWEDPTPGTGSACPSSTACRWSDVLAVRYSADTLSAGPYIARPSGAPAYGAPGGSKIIVGNFFVAGSFPYSILGEELHKIGRTSNWTKGNITGTCQAKATGDFMPGTPTPIWILCNDISDIYSDHGDSGAPIFKWYGEDSYVYFAGILWGGPVNNPYVTWHSPYNSIVKDMGQYTFYTW